MTEHLSATLTRLLPPVPVCAHPDCGRDLLDVRHGAQYCGARCRSAATAAERQRRARARKFRAKLAKRKKLEKIGKELIRQTRKRAVKGRVRMTAAEVADALLQLDIERRVEVVRILRESPERVGADDVMNADARAGRMTEFVEGTYVEDIEAEPELVPYASRDVLWCHANRAAGVLRGGSLGHVTPPKDLPKRPPRLADDE